MDIDDVGNVVGTVGPRDSLPFEQRAALWSPSGEFRWLSRPGMLSGKAWSISPEGFSSKGLNYSAVNEDTGEQMLGRVDLAVDSHALTPALPGDTKALMADSDWQLVRRDDRYFVATQSVEIELRMPANARTMELRNMTWDGRTLTGSLYMGEQNSDAIVWRCR